MIFQLVVLIYNLHSPEGIILAWDPIEKPIAVNETESVCQSLVPPTKKFQSIPVKSVTPGTTNFEEVLEDILTIGLDCTDNLWDTRAIKHELVEEWMVRVTVSEDDTTN